MSAEQEESDAERAARRAREIYFDHHNTWQGHRSASRRCAFGYPQHRGLICAYCSADLSIETCRGQAVWEKAGKPTIGETK